MRMIWNHKLERNGVVDWWCKETAPGYPEISIEEVAESNREVALLSCRGDHDNDPPEGGILTNQ